VRRAFSGETVHRTVSFSLEPRSRQIGRRNGVRCRFQVSCQSVEPRPASRALSRCASRAANRSEHCRARDLLAEDELRAAGCDEPQERGREMAVIVLSLALPGLGEGLAGRRAGPDGPILGHAGEAERIGPAADPGEEMALREAAQIDGLHLEDGSFVHLSGTTPAFSTAPTGS
jgi:hypothetical protein